MVGIALVIAAAVYLMRRIELNNALDSSEGYVSSPSYESKVGNRGVALTVLRPGGMVEVDGRRLDARAQGEFIEQGAEIEVIGVDGAQLVVDDLRESE